MEVELAIDILDKWEFFYGQRAGRELWAEKPTEVQNEDIANFCRGLRLVREALERTRWIPCSERLPEDLVLVNVVWVNRDPPTYYEKIKDVPISGTACRYKGNWYWDSPACIDQLAETGENKFDLVDDGIDITHWMPLPEPPEEVQGNE